MYNFSTGGPYTNDVAVLKLDGEVPVRPTVSAACMPSKDTKYEKGTWCYVSGWGITNCECKQVTVSFETIRFNSNRLSKLAFSRSL